jgi:hypothetical protein
MIARPLEDSLQNYWNRQKSAPTTLDLVSSPSTGGWNLESFVIVRKMRPRTLQIKDLLEYLPPGIILFPHVATHLNVARPLWHGFAKSKDDIYASAESGERRKAFSGQIRNSEGEYREYYQSLSRNFKDLKYSAKDALREYYLAADRRRVASLSASAPKRTREGLLHGVDKKVTGSGVRVKFGFISLRFPAR